MTVGDLEQRMTQSEYLYWVAYFNIKHMRQEMANMKIAGGGRSGK